MGRRPFTQAELTEMWERLEAGELPTAVARSLGRFPSAIYAVLRVTGGVRPRARRRRRNALTLAEREEISRGLAANEPYRAIAARLHRAPSTVCREVQRHAGRTRYRALGAEQRALLNARRPKPAKLAQCPQLRAVVEAKLALKWSPQQIATWLPVAYPGDLDMRVSHETIYLSLYVQGRGALRQELHRALRTGRAMRRSKKACGAVKGKLRDMVLVSERPAEVEDRAVPGHWEGDLIMGTRKTCIGTLVERSTRYVMLLKLERNTAEAVRAAMSRKILRLPAELRRSVTWDQGKEMAEHVRFTVDTGVQVYFCDPRSPWQRGTKENANGLLRQYFPRLTDLAGFGQRDLDAVARQLNERPRQTLGWMTPSQKLAEVVALTH